MVMVGYLCRARIVILDDKFQLPNTLSNIILSFATIYYKIEVNFITILTYIIHNGYSQIFSVHFRKMAIDFPINRWNTDSRVR
ncbi:unnamed protein product [Debaryomyces tyrocola]|nr:unnamed protein product [Debaryomyces tyrocola]